MLRKTTPVSENATKRPSPPSTSKPVILRHFSHDSVL
uniref:Uncharacterized protein n=1 Tax=Mesocestoides corti TaxID=53468 RepID=A0A5K3G5X0_MESCO